MSLPTTTNGQGRELAQALGRAAESGDAARVGELLAQGAAADARLEGGATALMRAAARGYADVARLLLDAGADVNARRADGFSPLVLAVFFGHEEVVRLLLEGGAHAGSPTRLGVTARGWAESRGFKAIGELLKNAPAPPAEAPRRSEAARERPPAAGTLPPGIRTESRAAGAEARPIHEPPALARGPRPDDDDPPLRPRTYEPQFQTPSRGFLGSWQASVGVFLLVAACGVGAFAIWQNRRGPAPQGAPTPAPAAAPQAAQPLPAQPSPDLAAQPAPTPSPDAQGGTMLPAMPGEVIVQPYTPYQPAEPDPAGAAAGGSNSAPAVVSEGGAPAAEPGPRRDARESRDGSLTAAPPAGRREDERPADDARADDATRRAPSPDAEARPAQPPYSPPPAPSPTPRSRVIQWPP